MPQLAQDALHCDTESATDEINHRSQHQLYLRCRSRHQFLDVFASAKPVTDARCRSATERQSAAVQRVCAALRFDLAPVAVVCSICRVVPPKANLLKSVFGGDWQLQADLSPAINPRGR